MASFDFSITQVLLSPWGQASVLMWKDFVYHRNNICVILRLWTCQVVVKQLSRQFKMFKIFNCWATRVFEGHFRHRFLVKFKFWYLKFVQSWIEFDFLPIDSTQKEERVNNFWNRWSKKTVKVTLVAFILSVDVCRVF